MLQLYKEHRDYYEYQTYDVFKADHSTRYISGLTWPFIKPLDSRGFKLYYIVEQL